MANIIIGGIVFLLAAIAIRNIIKNKGTCNCGNNNCNCCSNHCQDKK